MPLSDEQQRVVDAISGGGNVVSVSKPGTGKTTTALECARAVSGKTLLLTYNRKLKEESRERVARMGLGERVEVHSYHAAACKLFGQDSAPPDDALIYAALAADPVAPMSYSLIVVDEAQDMTPLFASLTRHILKHMTTPPQVLFIGDPFQRIFAFIGASCDYMMRPHEHFGALVRDAPFVQCHLSICWRITPEMAEYINTRFHPRHLADAAPTWWLERGDEVLAWWGDGVKSGKPSAPGSVTEVPPRAAALHAALAKHLPRFDAGECAYLCKSVRRPDSLLSGVIDAFAGADWAVTNETSAWEPSERLADGKAVVTTIQRFKGLERKFVCVLGVDSTWERMHEDNPLNLYALFFVALTRASEQLVVVGGSPAYATIRRTPLVHTQWRKYVPDAATLLQHVPFDDVLHVPWDGADNQGAVRAIVVERGEALCADDVDAARTLPGRDNKLVEDASPFLDDSIFTKVATQLVGDDVPATRARRLQRERLPASARTWLAARARSVKPWTAEDAFRLSIVSRVADTQYTHAWRQVQPHTPLLRLIATCAEIVHAHVLLAIETIGRERDRPQLAPSDAWRVDLPHTEEWELARETYDGAVACRSIRPHFVGSGIAITIVTGPVLRHDAVLLAALTGALRTMHTHQPVRSFLAHANGATLYEVETRLPPHELLLRVMQNKLKVH